jgi:hypothetical protein
MLKLGFTETELEQLCRDFMGKRFGMKCRKMEMNSLEG